MDVRAMVFNGPLIDTQSDRDYLVGYAANCQGKYIQLAPGQATQALLKNPPRLLGVFQNRYVGKGYMQFRYVAVLVYE